MAEHYFSEKPASQSSPKGIRFSFAGGQLMFVTDHGVFSRNAVDEGTELLLGSAVVHPGARVLDLGCGYGPVGVSIAKAVANARVWMVDINERAVALATKNAEANGVRDRVIIQQSDGTAGLAGDLLFDVVLLNPPIRAGKAVVWSLYRQAYDRLVDDGSLYIVIQKKQGAESSEKYLRSLFATVEIVARQHGYRVLVCKKATIV